jgi:hypothetical protein
MGWHFVCHPVTVLDIYTPGYCEWLLTGSEQVTKNIRLIRLKFTQISEECIASIFRVEKKTVQNAELSQE